MTIKTALSLAAALLAADAASAGGQAHSDVAVGVEGGRITTGAVDLDMPGSPVVPGVRVFESAFEVGLDQTDEPGFNARGNTTQNPLPFPPGTLIGFDLVDALREWDGEDFDLVAGETVTVFLGLNPDITTPPVPDGFVAGFNFASAGSTGGFHQHINFFLDAPAQDGVYLLSLRLRASGGVIQPSETIWIVFRQGDEPALVEAQEVAVAYMNALLDPAGCPGDANGDLLIDFNDIVDVLAHWLADYAPASGPGDANHDGVVDFNDIAGVLGHWGGPCP